MCIQLLFGRLRRMGGAGAATEAGVAPESHRLDEDGRYPAWNGGPLWRIGACRQEWRPFVANGRMSPGVAAVCGESVVPELTRRPGSRRRRIGWTKVAAIRGEMAATCGESAHVPTNGGHSWRMGGAGAVSEAGVAPATHRLDEGGRYPGWSGGHLWRIGARRQEWRPFVANRWCRSCLGGRGCAGVASVGRRWPLSGVEWRPLVANRRTSPRMAAVCGDLAARTASAPAHAAHTKAAPDIPQRNVRRRRLR
ncbi:hypothetical protein J2X01_001955 [Arthrobacter ginsengisoli]|uniref:Uncharacterized protein n=1 Tax=Arthrobacter ginsengisoli TaxID=1356565 RepID=A0ABU1UBW2_9MICC|nr:hypothetical protein [Arthrobacter ginsengisoli]